MEVDAELQGVEESLDALSNFVDKQDAAMKEALEYILRLMINDAKDNGNYVDRTGNLRNSLSINIKTMQEYPADTDPEVIQSKVVSNEEPVIEVKGNNFKGVISVGMEYGIWVETSKGYSVITGTIDKFEPLIEKYFADRLKVGNLDLIGAMDTQYSKFLKSKGLTDSQISTKIADKHAQYGG